MARRVAPAVLAALVAAGTAAGCGDEDAPKRAAQPPAAEERTAPSEPSPQSPAQPDPRDLLSLLVPKGGPTEPGGPADREDRAVVKRGLAARTTGDIEAAADAFADGTLVQNLRPPMRLADRADRLEFNAGFPCGAEIVDASSVKGYLVVTYRLTDRVDSPCDGPGGRAAGTIRVKDGRITEWYRLPDPLEQPSEPAGPVV